ncbi:hypothetical protein FB451DRAFT_1179062 [Mycena latifolia]|nr:hypothetical protein FB451DRAFT_1179062 [Mycena latifolia]
MPSRGKSSHNLAATSNNEAQFTVLLFLGFHAGGFHFNSSCLASGVDGEAPLKTRIIYSPELIAELMSLHRGQGLEFIWRDSLYCLSGGGADSVGTLIVRRNQRSVADRNSAHDDTRNNKHRCVTFLAGIDNRGSDLVINRDYVLLMNLIGLFCQIRDDLMSLESPMFSSTKGFAKDLSEGLASELENPMAYHPSGQSFYPRIYQHARLMGLCEEFVGSTAVWRSLTQTVAAFALVATMNPTLNMAEMHKNPTVPETAYSVSSPGVDRSP